MDETTALVDEVFDDFTSYFMSPSLHDSDLCKYS